MKPAAEMERDNEALRERLTRLSQVPGREGSRRGVHPGRRRDPGHVRLPGRPRDRQRALVPG